MFDTVSQNMNNEIRSFAMFWSLLDPTTHLNLYSPMDVSFRLTIRVMELIISGS